MASNSNVRTNDPTKVPALPRIPADTPPSLRRYLELLEHVLINGEERTDRTGTGTLSVFGSQLRFSLNPTFPLLTTKKLHLRSIIYELLWFLKGVILNLQ